MNRFAVLFLVPALVLGARPAPRHKALPKHSVAPVPSGPATVIEDVSVIDVASGRAIPHQDVVIRGERISEVRNAKTRRAEVRYVIPGLWDMHVHLWFPRSQFPLYIANGVTGVRDMGSGLSRVREWQKLAGVPRIYTGGDPIADRPSDMDEMPVNVVRTPQEARAIFNRYYDQRVDFIKVLDVSRGVFEALAEASRHGGIPFAGHLPIGVSAFEAAQDRMVSMEHLFGIAFACSRKENELRGKAVAGNKAAATAEAINTYDAAAARALFEDFRRYDVRQTPTLAMWERMAGLAAAPEEVKYVDAPVRAKWKEPTVQATRAEFDFALKVTGEMWKAGVGILAGTDTGDPWTVPGVSLHHELALLVRAGLTPAAALRAATMEPARLLHHEAQAGQVRAGYVADLVVLRGNPLENIENTTQIDAVVLRGKQHDKAAIARMVKGL